MDRLLKLKVGFNDVESFNLGLIYNSKTINFENYTDVDDKKVVETAMKFKYKDEVRNRKKLVREKLKMRKMINGELGERTADGRRMLRHLHGVAEKKREELREKYERKIEHLKMKYERNKDKEKDRLPADMIEFEGIAVMDQENFDNIERKEIEVVKYGEVELDKEEEAAMKLHPKMALPRKIREGFMNLPLDISYTKLRWQMKKDEENTNAKDDQRKDEITDEETKKKEEENEVEEARTRSVYDAETKVYDERKQRVTDLQECSRIFLPKPLEVTKEAQLEMRRELHTRISEEFRRKKCDEQGNQGRTISREELAGLRKLEKRKDAGEIVVIMTDKSSKLCIMKREDYLKLGEEHVGKDQEI